MPTTVRRLEATMPQQYTACPFQVPANHMLERVVLITPQQDERFKTKSGCPRDGLQHASTVYETTKNSSAPFSYHTVMAELYYRYPSYPLWSTPALGWAGPMCSSSRAERNLKLSKTSQAPSRCSERRAQRTARAKRTKVPP